MKRIFYIVFITLTVTVIQNGNAQAIDPDSLAGTYLGMWNNTTFGSSGGASLVTTLPGNGSTMELILDLDGFVGGMIDPDPRTLNGTISSTQVTVDTSLDEGDLLLTWSADATLMWEFTNMTTPGFDRQSGIGTGTSQGIDIEYTVWFTNGDSAIGTAQLTKQTSSFEEQVDNMNPNSYRLFNNYPNPFNPSTTINYSIPEQTEVSIKVFNEVGEEVAVLLNEVKPRGVHSLIFDASNYSSGVYIYKMSTSSFTKSKKMILAK